MVRFVFLALLTILFSSVLPASIDLESPSSRPNWTRVGALYTWPSSPGNPFVLTPDEPPNSWWTVNFSLFGAQKYIDEMMLNRALSNHPSKAVAVYFPQFLADLGAFGTKYLEELKEVITFFHEKGFHILIYLGRTDQNAYARWMDPVRNPTEWTYLQRNVNRTIRYKDMYDYIDEVTLCWQGDHLSFHYTSEEVSEYNKQVKSLINAVGIPFLVHVDGTWFEDDLNRTGYTPQSVSPKFGCSDGLWAESWAQGVLPNCLSRLVPEYFTPSQINIVCDVPNGYLDPTRLHNTPGNSVEEDMDYWFRCIQNVGITSWYVWDYYGSFEHVPSSFSLIYPNATTLTRKGEYVKRITQTGLSYRDVAVTEVSLYKTVYGQNSATYVNATILNQGDSAETFNFTIFANSTIIHTESVTLIGGNSSKIEFPWNTTLPLGTYAIRAEASIENDTDTSDNVYTFGLVTIVIKGDVNADGRVNILDISMAAASYGLDPDNPKWNANADIDENETINIMDISAIAKEYGKTV